MSEVQPSRIAIGPWLASANQPGDLRSVQRVEGLGSAPFRVSVEPKSRQDGGHDAKGFRDPRRISIEGTVQQVSASAAKAAADELTSLSPGELYEFTVDNDHSGSRSCMVRVSVGADPEWLNARAFKYSIQVVAPDPTLYGPPLFGGTTLSELAGTGLTFPLTFPLDFGVPDGTTPGAITMPNAGTAAYWPRLRIDGPVTNPVVTLNESGAWLRVGRSIEDGQWLDVDCAARAALLNGLPTASVMPQVTFSGDWLAVPPGGGGLTWSADTSGPGAQLSAWFYESAWN